MVRAQPPASGLLAGITLNSLVSNLGVRARLKSCNFDKGGEGGGGVGKVGAIGLTSS